MVLKMNIKKRLSYIPLLLMPAINILNYDLEIELYFMVWLIIWSCIEEYVFRGIFLSILTEKYNKRILFGTIFSSLVFAFFHLINYYSYASLRYTIIQVLCAWSVGFCLAIIACDTKKIRYGIMIHILINLTSMDRNNQSGILDLSSKETCFYSMVSVIYAVYGIILYYYVLKHNKICDT